jgi:hypothetical protein
MCECLLIYNLCVCVSVCGNVGRRGLRNLDLANACVSRCPIVHLIFQN